MQFIAQELLDGAFIFGLHFGVVRQHSGGAELCGTAFGTGREQLLHGLRRVGMIAQNLLEGFATSPIAGHHAAQRFGARRGLLLIAAGIRQARLRLGKGLLQLASVFVHRLPADFRYSRPLLVLNGSFQ